MALSWSRTVDLFPEMNPDGLYEEKFGYEELDFAHDSASTIVASNSSTTNLACDDSSSTEESHTPEKKLIRRVDLRMLPILGALYAISLVDRVNVRSSPA